MGEHVAYFETGSTDPSYNLAFEEIVLTSRTDCDCLILWQNDRAVIVGQNQNTEEEINRSYVEEHGIKVVRRSTGGGAVYHDLGNLNYSFITDAGDAERITMQRFTEPVVEALKKLGLDAATSGRNDILVSGKKVSGTAQRLLHGRILHHGTLLFDSDLEAAAGALNAKPEKFISKSAKSVRSRIGNIRDFLPRDMELPEFRDYLKNELCRGTFLNDRLTSLELALVDSLRTTRYAAWDWNFGRSPACGMKNSRRWDGGTLEVRISVEHGLVTDIVFYGDFLSLTSLTNLCKNFCGRPFTPESFAAVLNETPVELYFGGITRQQILDTIFY